MHPERRKDIFLATKFGAIRTDTGFSFRGDAAYVPIAVEQNLKRLRVDTIDLYYPHRVDGSTPVEHIVTELVKLKESVPYSTCPSHPRRKLTVMLSSDRGRSDT